MKRETTRLLREWAYYASLGLQVALSVVIGLAIGLYLDKRFGTAPWCMLVFLVMGIVAGYRNIGLAIKKNAKILNKRILFLDILFRV